MFWNWKKGITATPTIINIINLLTTQIIIECMHKQIFSYSTSLNLNFNFLRKEIKIIASVW